MPQELSSAIEVPFRHRVRHGVRRTHNWLQLFRFVAVGASGYVVNLLVFAVCVHAMSIDYHVAAFVAFAVSVLNNFWWNRHWTFDARDAKASHQGLRFFAVSLVTFGFTYVLLVALVNGPGLPKLVAQATAIVAGTPLSFVGQKLWSFKA